MKTELPERSLVIKERLEAITEAILGKDQRIAMIILFGSYAKGTWVKDSYIEDHRTYAYESDIDILVVTKGSQFSGIKGASFKSDLERRLERKGLAGMAIGEPVVTIIVDPIQHLNNQLEKNRYFYSDIKKEGVMLYDSGEFKLAEPKDLSCEERREIGKEDFEQWFPQGAGFMDTALYTLKQGRLNHSAFELHQATESFYTAILLVFTGYKGKGHDIKEFGSLASNYSDELLKIFPRETEEQKQCFTLLREAYIRARYDKNYKITEEQLLYLVQRVEKLKTVTEEICQAWINLN